MRRAGSIVLLLLALEGSAKGQARVVAVDETTMPRLLPELRSRHVVFDSLITAVLESAGFTVITPGVTAATWQRVRDSLGGYYDRFTGRVVAGKLQAVETATFAVLRHDHHVDVWIRPSVATVQASFRGRKASWDGVQEGSGGVIGDGILPALSLIVPVFDSAGHAVYQGIGGIELKSKADGETPPLLRDAARIVHAVHLAMDSLRQALH
ncbi:MAG TPA: hypothetical protein VNX15_12855 [Gemmatimonadales bacterium]|nr:hypothetical protein [Gemmatimonadales bacterium]